MLLFRVFALFLLTTIYGLTNASAFELSDLGISGGSKKYKYYNESKDINEDGKSKKEKDFSKIGFEDYSQKNIWRKFYVGIDINWYLKRCGDNIDKQVFYTDFFKRFQNLDVYGGTRIFKYFGTEIGYTHFGNFTAKDGRRRSLDGAYISAMLYSPMLDLKYTTIEGYITIGGTVLAGSSKNGKGEVAGRFGGGLVLQVYGPVSFNIGVDYYYGLKSYAKRGFLAIKTGFNFYLNI